jgi:hypothetical protein
LILSSWGLDKPHAKLIVLIKPDFDPQPGQWPAGGRCRSVPDRPDGQGDSRSPAGKPASHRASTSGTADKTQPYFERFAACFRGPRARCVPERLCSERTVRLAHVVVAASIRPW